MESMDGRISLLTDVWYDDVTGVEKYPVTQEMKVKVQLTKLFVIAI